MKTRLYSETLGIPVLSSQGNYRVGRVHDILVDDQTGRIAAFVLGHRHILLPQDVLQWRNYLLVPDEHVISPVEDIIRIQELLKRHSHLFGKRVITEQGEYIGHIWDLEFHVDPPVLKNLHTAKIFLFFKFEQRIIPVKHIVEIRKKTVVVKDPRARQKEKESIMLPQRPSPAESP